MSLSLVPVVSNRRQSLFTDISKSIASYFATRAACHNMCHPRFVETFDMARVA